MQQNVDRLGLALIVVMGSGLQVTELTIGFRPARALKGAAGSIGATAIFSLAKALDLALKQGERAAAQAALLHLAERLSAIVAALRIVLAGDQEN